MMRLAGCSLLIVLLALLFFPEAALAQTTPPAPSQGFNFEGLLPAGEQTVTGRMVQLIVLITMLSVAPGLLMMVTCFTRFVIVLSLLRAGIGLQTTPANMILVSLALFMTLYVMAPTFDKIWQNGLKPFAENKITEEEAYTQITQPLREFMMANVRPKDLELFEDLAEERFGLQPGPDSQVELRVLIPAFMISELRRGFEMGFLVVLPFLVIDLIVATLTMSMGMMMLPPTVMSLPFKVLFFVLIDGWNLLIGGLVRSFP
jgi:flagellar biosynthetic protein FliP